MMTNEDRRGVKNAEIVEEPRGHLCGWCFKGTTSMKLVDHCLDEYCQEGT